MALDRRALRQLLPRALASLVGAAGPPALDIDALSEDVCHGYALLAALPSMQDTQLPPEPPAGLALTAVSMATDTSQHNIAAARRELRQLLASGALVPATQRTARQLAEGRQHSLQVFPSAMLVTQKPTGTKGRLVACQIKSKNPVPHVDCYSPTASPLSIRTAIAVGVLLRLEFDNVDVKAAYLQATNGGEPTETVWLRPFARFDLLGAGGDDGAFTTHSSSGELMGWICHGNLYGTRWAGKRWYETLREWLVQNGFSAVAADPCFFVRWDGDFPTLLLVYVDDVGIFAHPMAMRRFKAEFAQRFACSDTGGDGNFLGLHLHQSEDRRRVELTVGNGVYDRLAEKLGRWRLKRPPATPTAPDINDVVREGRRDAEGPEVACADFDFRAILGIISFLAHQAVPHLALAVSLLSTLAARPTRRACLALARVASYALEHRQPLVFEHTPDLVSLETTVHVDAAFDDRGNGKSTVAFFVQLNGMSVHWGVGQTKRLTGSSHEAEMAAATRGVKAALALLAALHGLGLQRVPGGDPVVLTDSLPVKQNAESDMISNESRHLCREIYFLRELVRENAMRLKHVPGTGNHADFLTKHLSEATARRSLALLMGW